MKYFLVLALLCTSTFVTAAGQNGNRFPAPLGIDRILTGIVEQTSPSAQNSSVRPSHFRLKTEENVYALHGREEHLKKFVGKRVRINGHVVGNDVDVQSVELQASKD